MSLKIEYHSQENVTQYGMSLKMECHSKWNVIKKRMSLKMECHSKWNVTEHGMSLKVTKFCHIILVTKIWSHNFSQKLL